MNLSITSRRCTVRGGEINEAPGRYVEAGASGLMIPKDLFFSFSEGCGPSDG